MSLPPLPESFGNYAIRGIAEVLPPEPVSWIPVTTGWRLLGAAILLWVIYQGYRQYRAWRRDRYRRPGSRFWWPEAGSTKSASSSLMNCGTV